MSRLNLGASADSPYAIELQRNSPSLRFSPVLESEYTLAHLRHSRTLIRVACLLAALLAMLRVGEQLIERSGNTVLLIDLALLTASSILLAVIAWSAAFERLYLRSAQVIVPVRNAIVAVHVAAAAAHGYAEMLMILPIALIGPFFFLGLSFRTAAFCGALTVAFFIVAATVFGMALPAALRTYALLLLGLVACAIAGWHLEKHARTSFLESHIIADLAQHDALTGTKNRRVMDEYLARLWQQAVEDRRTIAIVLLDVDHFKAYNDRYGHQAGDETLRRVAQTAQKFVRRPLDVLTRYGGEEFAAILFDVDATLAMGVADRIRTAVECLRIEHRGSRTSPSVTISAGVALVRPTADRTPQGALQLADQALYEAKTSGRNQVALMDEAQHKLLETGVFASDPSLIAHS